MRSSQPASGAAKGGRTRAERLSPADRQAIAREAALARWGDVLPRAVASGALSIGGLTIDCAVLRRDGAPEVRVATQRTVLRAIGRVRPTKSGTGPGDLGGLLSAENLRPYLSAEVLRAASPVKFRGQNGEVMFGYDASILPEVCRAYVDASKDEALWKSQEPVARNCAVLLQGLAQGNVIGLVDAATGHDEQRARDDLNRILEHYIAPELMPWTRRFPEEFFRQIYRLQGWEYRPGTAKRTPFIGHLINKYVYEHLPTGILRELRRTTPKVADLGYRKFKDHQFTSAATGSPQLDTQIAVVTTLMRVSGDRAELQRLLGAAFDVSSLQRLPLVVDLADT